MRVVAVVNQKGGVGKTGTTCGVGGALAERGRRVLLVDLDPQGHLTVEALGLPEVHDEHENLAAALTGRYVGDLRALVAHHSTTAAGGVLDVLPTTLDMFTLSRELDKVVARETRLRRLLADFADDYDFVLIDCPPSLDILTDNALASADEALLPIQPRRMSARALLLLINQLDSITDALDLTPIHIHGMVPMYRRPLPILHRQVMAELAESGIPMLSVVPEGVAVDEAFAQGRTVVALFPDSPQAAAYREIADTIEGRAA